MGRDVAVGKHVMWERVFGKDGAGSWPHAEAYLGVESGLWRAW